MQVDSALPDFSGKLVVLYIASAPHGIADGVLFEFPEFKIIGQRLFVVGRVPDVDGQEWVSKLQSGVAWDAVVSYVLFDSREEYQQRFSAVRPSGFARLLGRT